MATDKRTLNEQKKRLADAIEEVVEEVEYTSHRHQIEESRPSPERIAGLERALLTAFEGVISYESVPFVRFGDLNASNLPTRLLLIRLSSRPSPHA